MGVPTEGTFINGCDCSPQCIAQNLPWDKVEGYTLIYPHEVKPGEMDEWTRDIPKASNKEEFDSILLNGMIAAPFPREDVTLFAATAVVRNKKILMVPLTVLYCFTCGVRREHTPQSLQAEVYANTYKSRDGAPSVGETLLVEDRNVYDKLHGTSPAPGLYFRNDKWKGRFGYTSILEVAENDISIWPQSLTRIAYRQPPPFGPTPLIHREEDGWFGEWIQFSAYNEWIRKQLPGPALARLGRAFLHEKNPPFDGFIKVEKCGRDGITVYGEKKIMSEFRMMFSVPSESELVCFAGR